MVEQNVERAFPPITVPCDSEACYWSGENGAAP
jgi:hypothetical protein